MNAPPPNRLEQLWGWVVLPLLLLVFVALTTPLVEAYGGFDYDGRFYGAISGSTLFDPEMATQAPWCWRILTPGFVSLLPWSTIDSFRIVGFVSNWLTLALLFQLLRRYALSARSATVGVLLYAGVFWALKFSWFAPAYVDFQAQTLLVALLLSLASERFWVAVVVFTVGALQKESLLLFLPTALFALWRTPTTARRQRVLVAVAMIVAPALTLMIVHRAIRPTNDYSSLQALLFNLNGLTSARWWLILLHAAMSGLGLLPAILLLNLRAVVRRIREQPMLLLAILTGVGALFGGVDKSRIFLSMLPAVVVVAASVLRDSADRGGLVTVWLAVTLLVHWYIGNLLSPMGSFEHYLDRMAPEHAPATSRAFLQLFLALSAGWALLSVGWKSMRPKM